RLQRLLHCGQPPRLPCRLDPLERLPVHARGAPTLLAERVGVRQDVGPIDLVVQQVEAIGRVLLGLGVQRLLESPELVWRCQAHATLLPLASSKRTPNQGAFPPHRFCCPMGPCGTMRPSDARHGARPSDGLRGATPRRNGPPVLRHALCRRATPPTPVSDREVIGRLLLRHPAAFPVIRAGRPSRLHFRGLLGLHTCCGPSTRRPTHGGPLSRELQQVGHPPCRLGSYRGAPTIPRAGLAPARNTAPLHGAPNNAGYEPSDAAASRRALLASRSRSEGEPSSPGGLADRGSQSRGRVCAPDGGRRGPARAE